MSTALKEQALALKRQILRPTEVLKATTPDSECYSQDLAVLNSMAQSQTAETQLSQLRSGSWAAQLGDFLPEQTWPAMLQASGGEGC